MQKVEKSLEITMSCQIKNVLAEKHFGLGESKVSLNS